MQNLTQIIRSALLGVLPMHLVNTIAPRVAEAIVNEYGGSEGFDNKRMASESTHNE